MFIVYYSGTMISNGPGPGASCRHGCQRGGPFRVMTRGSQLVPILIPLVRGGPAAPETWLQSANWAWPNTYSVKPLPVRPCCHGHLSTGLWCPHCRCPASQRPCQALQETGGEKTGSSHIFYCPHILNRK